MSDSIPYLGCKISLISKSEIRYEGILYTIDAQESIIALAKVQSFGTEDRPAEMPVPMKDDIYEYIIFRGTDIKKIEICDTAKPQVSGVHNDPAIVGLQVQQHSNAPIGTSSYPSTSFGHHQSLGPIGSTGSYYGNFGSQLGPNIPPTSGFSIGTGISQPQSELSNDIGGVIIDPQSPSRSGRTVPTPIGVMPQSHQELSGSRSSTPSITRKSPVVDAGVQVSPQQQQREQARRPPHQQTTRGQPPQQDRKRTSNLNAPLQERQAAPPPPLLAPDNEKFSKEPPANFSRRGGSYTQSHVHQNQSRGGSGYHGGYQQHQHPPQYQQQYRPVHPGRGRAPNRRGGGPSRGGSGRPGLYNQGSRPRAQDHQAFTEEFDFEEANEKFEELCTKLDKAKISAENPPAAAGESSNKNNKNNNGDAPEKDIDGGEERGSKEPKKDDSGHETATTGDESEDSNNSVYYDKAKSFFDNISCEALERSKGKTQRSDWRQERRINVQTFGIASARRGYFPRGRGGYYGRGASGGGGGYYGRGAYYRGGNQGGYRNTPRGGNYRGGPGGQGGRYAGMNGRVDSGPQRNPTKEPASEPNGGGGGSSYASALRGGSGASGPK